MVVKEAAGGDGTLYYRFDAETKGFDVKMQGINKGLADTAKSAKKAGNEGQKAMSQWEKGLNKAGGAAYDFGTQAFASTTVMEALQEGVSGALEMALVERFSDLMSLVEDKDYARLFAEMFFGEDFVEYAEASFKPFYDWVMGEDKKRAEEAKAAMAQSYSDTDFAKLIQHKMIMEDWSGITDFLNERFGEGDYSDLVSSIKLSISSGNYELAAKYINDALAEYDYDLLGLTKATDTWSAEFQTTAKELFTDPDKSPAAMLQQSIDKVDWAHTAGKAVEAFKGANWDSATDNIEGALERWGSKFAEIMKRHLKDIEAGLDITVAETTSGSRGGG